MQGRCDYAPLYYAVFGHSITFTTTEDNKVFFTAEQIEIKKKEGF
jgi:hypothetical protein